MKLKNNWKRFWTLDRHHAAGFTLVELIVVIAILAILAGVGIPVYSGYITKTNIQADRALIAEIEQALVLAHYSGKLNPGANVVVHYGEDGDPVDVSDTSADAAMIAAFGSNYANTLRLKHDGWNGDYADSSFSGKETVLMTHVEDLTGVLSQTITNVPALVGPNFTNYMSTELKFNAEDLANADKVADAAVLYVANGTSKLTPAQKKEFSNIAKNAGSAENVFSDMLTNYARLYGGSAVMGASAAYAMLTAYCQYEDKLAGNTKMMDALGTPDSSGVATGSLEEMITMIDTSVNRLNDIIAERGEEGEKSFYKYFNEVAAQDAAAFVDAMTTANNAKDQVTGRLGITNCFDSEDLKTIFINYSNGSVTVILDIQPDGTPKPMAIPEMG